VHSEQLGADTFIYFQTEAEGKITMPLFREIHCSPGSHIWLTPALGHV
jgi:hypothetical protein